MRKNHPLAGQTLTQDDYLNAEHLVPTPYAVGQRGVIDMQLARERLKRNVVASVPYFNLVPYVLLQNDIIFSAPRIFAEHCCSLGDLCYSESPLDFPKMRFYLLWHDRAHHSEECRWFREQIVDVIRESITVIVNDQSGMANATDTAVINLTVHGTNQAPQLTATTCIVKEDENGLVICLHDCASDD